MTMTLKALSCLDLTNLEADCSEADIVRLCQRAVTPHGAVAAVCIWPRFVDQALYLLAETPVRIATVVNFPGGDQPLDAVISETIKALEDGADEIDLVIPYTRVSDEPQAVIDMIAGVREAAPDALLKTILETGELKDEALIRKASELALQAGADFLKTSTGKVAINATLDAARVMLETIRDHGATAGFKAAGGIRTPQIAADYLKLADEIMGAEWAGPDTFRFGASGLVDALLAELDGGTVAPNIGY